MTGIKIFDTDVSARVFQSNIKVKAFLGILMCSLLVGCQTMSKGESATALDGADPVQTTEELIREGDTALSQNNIDIAKIKYALALEQDNRNLDAMYKLGVVHGHSGAMSVAEGLLRRVRTLNPEHLDAREELGLVLLKMKKMDEAEELLEEALEARPASTKVLNAMGIIKDLNAEHAEAQSLFLAALYIAPDSEKIQNNLGYSYYLAGDYENAEQHMRNATDIKADYSQAWSNLALVYSRQGRYSESRSAFRKVVSESQTANNIGYLSLLQEDDKVAREELKKAVTLSSAYYEIANENLVALDRSRNLSKVSSDTGINPKQSSPEKTSSATNRVVVGKPLPNEKLSVGEIQSYLNYLGYSVGKIDGKSGKKTREAIRKFQSGNSLPVTGRNTTQTQKRLLKVVVLKVQGTLKMLGYNAGKADGVPGRATINAVNDFRENRKMPVNGKIDEDLLNSLQESLSRNLDHFSDPNSLDISARG